MVPIVSQPEKVALLRRMLERRAQLFSGFGGQTTAQTIAEEWKRLWSFCESNGYSFCADGRGWDYFRNQTWANWKSSHLFVFAFCNKNLVGFQERHDNSLATGSGAYEPTLADDLVLQIVDKNSPLVAELTDKRKGERMPTPPMHNKRGTKRTSAEHPLDSSSTSATVVEQASTHPLNGLSSSLMDMSTVRVSTPAYLQAAEPPLPTKRNRRAHPRAHQLLANDAPKLMNAKRRLVEYKCHQKLLENRILENYLRFPHSHTFAHELNGRNQDNTMVTSEPISITSSMSGSASLSYGSASVALLATILNGGKSQREDDDWVTLARQ